MASSNGSTPPLSEAVHNALRQYYKSGITDSPFAHLTLYQLLRNQAGSTPRQATNYLLNQALDLLQKTQPDYVALLRMRFMDRKSSRQAANNLNVSESTLSVRQKTAIGNLADVLNELESNARGDQHRQLEQRLEAASNVNVIGIDAQVEELLTFIQPDSTPWIISIEGLGGIGKTTLADALMRRALDANLYHEIGWVSAKAERLTFGGTISQIRPPALTTEQFVEQIFRQLFPKLYPTFSHDAEQMHEKLYRQLKEVPHLIVVDNLETVEDVETLLPTLQTFANPTKFVLTSREQTYGQPNICQVKVRPLCQNDALLLMRQEAQLRNLPVLAASPDDVLRPVYELVGGHPLALRLVIGQTHLYSLTTILADLETARGKPIQNLYSFIYQKSWEGLDETERHVFLAMASLPKHGDDIEQLAGLTDYDMETTRNALNQLVTQSLVDADGDYRCRRYKIHSLTRTFLREDIAKWGATA